LSQLAAFQRQGTELTTRATVAISSLDASWAQVDHMSSALLTMNRLTLVPSLLPDLDALVAMEQWVSQLTPETKAMLYSVDNVVFSNIQVGLANLCRRLGAEIVAAWSTRYVDAKVWDTPSPEHDDLAIACDAMNAFTTLKDCIVSSAVTHCRHWLSAHNKISAYDATSLGADKGYSNILMVLGRATPVHAWRESLAAESQDPLYECHGAWTRVNTHIKTVQLHFAAKIGSGTKHTHNLNLFRFSLVDHALFSKTVCMFHLEFGLSLTFALTLYPAHQHPRYVKLVGDNA
jgi:hypothetical protein